MPRRTYWRFGRNFCTLLQFYPKSGYLSNRLQGVTAQTNVFYLYAPFCWTVLNVNSFIMVFINQPRIRVVCTFFCATVSSNFYILFTVNPNVMIVFFTNFIHKFFILIHLLYSSTCFEHYCAHLHEDIYISTASGVVTLFKWLFRSQVIRLQQVTRGLESSRNLCTEQSPKEGDDTRCCTNTIVLLKMSITVLETCRGM